MGFAFSYFCYIKGKKFSDKIEIQFCMKFWILAFYSDSVFTIFFFRLSASQVEEGTKI